MINRKKLVDKRLKSMEYWLQYSKEFAEIEQKTHNPDLNMNIAPIRAPSPALYNAWDSSYLHDIDYLVDMMVTEKLLTGYFAERQVLKDWLRLSDVYLYQQITREAKRRKIGNANLDVALCLAASLRQIFKFDNTSQRLTKQYYYTVLLKNECKSFVLEEELPYIISSKADNDNKQANRLRKAQEKENKKIRNIGDAHDKNQTNNKKRKRSTKKSTQQSNKKAKIDDQFVMSDMFVEYDQDADDEDGEEDTFDFGTETVTEVENVFVSAYNLRSKNRV